MIKRLVYRFAFWLEMRAVDLKYWATPADDLPDCNETVCDGIDRSSNPLWRNKIMLPLESYKIKFPIGD